MTGRTRILLLGAAALLGAVGVVAFTSDDADAPETAGTTTTTTTLVEPPTTTAAPTTTSAPATTSSTTTLDLEAAAVERFDRAARAIDEATPEELAYRLIVTGLTGSDLTGRLRDTVGSACVGGIFLTESNANWLPTGDPDAFRAARTGLPDDCDVPPLITTDAELGSVVRVPVESPPAAPEWRNRYVDGEADAVVLDLEEQSTTYAEQLRDLGIDVNFGAVADVATSPEYFMSLQERTFGDDPAAVFALSDAVVRGHCAAGVAATLKHFPNQGATVEDPHAQRSTAIGGAELWESTGRIPYVDTTAPVVMTGHIFLADIDPDLPASMSQIITTGLLRDDLGYEGLVITDDFSTMRGAIDVVADAGDRAVAAIEAGADLVLFVDDDDIPGVVETLAAAIETDEEFRDNAVAAATRTLKLSFALREPDYFPLCEASSD